MLLHVPLVPSRLLAWLQLYMMLGSSDDAGETDGEVIIPIDFDLADDAPPAPAEPPPPAPPPEAADPEGTPVPAASSDPTPPKKKTDAALDGGVDASADAPEDAPEGGPEDAGVDAPEDAPADAPDDAGVIAKLGTLDASDGLLPSGLFPDAGAPVEVPDAGDDAGDAGRDAGPLEVASAADAGAGAPKVNDPAAKVGGPARLAKNPAVQILIAGDRIRTHELGLGFAKILKSIPQWNDFFQGSNVDPIKDLDHMFLAGPQFKVDSSRVVAVMDYNRSEKDIRAAVDGIVTRSGGEWIKDAPIPAARAKADKAERIFAMIPGKKILVILPASEKDQLEKLKSLPSFNKSSRVGISVAIVSPARPFKGIITLPDSLKKLKLDVIPTPDGGADLSLELEDASPEDAQKHAGELTHAIDLFRMANQIKIPFTSITIDVMDKVTFFAEGSAIRATTHLSVKQLRGIMGFAELQFQEQKKLLEQKQKGGRAPRQ